MLPQKLQTVNLQFTKFDHKTTKKINFVNFNSLDEIAKILQNKMIILSTLCKISFWIESFKSRLNLVYQLESGTPSFRRHCVKITDNVKINCSLQTCF